MKTFIAVLGIAIGAVTCLQSIALAAEGSAHWDLKPEADQWDVSPTILNEMGVVQKKAIEKAKKLLFSTSGAMDFSDGPFTFYRVNAEVGYALTDFLELYAGIAPIVVNKKRAFAEMAESVMIEGQGHLSFDSAKIKRQYMVTLLYAPLYGKDSLSVRTIVRSDTFVKLGWAMVSYDGQSGSGAFAGLGKTFFLGRRAGLRVGVVENYIKNLMPDGSMRFTWVTNLETGLVFYLL